MINLYSQLGYSTDESQALQYIVFVVFVTLDWLTTSLLYVGPLFGNSFKRQLVCKFDTTVNVFFSLFLFLFIYTYSHVS